MTLCEKCIHGDVCAYRDGMNDGDEKALTQCSDYKNKADLVEAVRCKDCEHWIYWADEKRCSCDLHHTYTIRDDFCSYGERRKDEDG